MGKCMKEIVEKLTFGVGESFTKFFVAGVKVTKEYCVFISGLCGGGDGVGGE